MTEIDSIGPAFSRGCSGCAAAAPAMFPFTMAFQPIVDIVQGRIVAHEALVRGPAGEGAAWVLGQVTEALLYRFDQDCRVKAIEMAARLGMPGRLNINFLPNAVYEPRACIRATLEAAARTGFDPSRLTFEIVETEIVADREHLQRIVAEYRRQRFRVALDDFGTGYSGLARLAWLRPDAIKLDREIVAGCDQDHLRLGIIASMVALGQATGIEVVAEGVEREGEFYALRQVGIRVMQGFWFSRPVFESFSSVASLANRW